MSLEKLKIETGDIALYGVSAAPDKLQGTAQENKELFDRLIRECFALRYNELIDRLGSGGGSYILPIASAATLGGIKIGSGLAIDENGVVSVVGGVSDLPNGDEVEY